MTIHGLKLEIQKLNKDIKEIENRKKLKQEEKEFKIRSIRKGIKNRKLKIKELRKNKKCQK